jgi:hypothetical protein
MIGTVRERLSGHFELRAYNAARGMQVTKTCAHPWKENGVGSAEAKKQLGGVEVAKLTTRELVRWYDALLARQRTAATLMHLFYVQREPIRSGRKRDSRGNCRYASGPWHTTRETPTLHR